MEENHAYKLSNDHAHAWNSAAHVKWHRQILHQALSWQKACQRLSRNRLQWTHSDSAGAQTNLASGAKFASA
jgi:hypothetical protein